MRSSWFTIAVLLFSSSSITAHPQPASEQLAQRDAFAVLDTPASEAHDHWKRKGGGGGGGRGGGGGGSSGGSRGGSSSSSSGSGRTSTGSNLGGSTSRGSGVGKNYGGGRYYGGGATVPYAAGSRSPAGLAAVPLLGVALLAYPGWALYGAYGAYGYNYYHPYSYYNRTAARRNASATSTTSSAIATPTVNGKRGVVSLAELVERQMGETGQNETKPITCLCAQYLVCGCDDNGDVSFLNALIGDGDYNKLNKTLINVADINGTSTIIINGTLPNGTTAPGGVDDASAANIQTTSLIGYLVMVVTVGFTCFMI